MSGAAHFKDMDSYMRAIRSLEEMFRTNDDDLLKIRHLARRIKKELENISPFIQQATEIVCPQCREVCCISKHGYYTHEDLVYLTALGLKPPHMIFGRDDPDPCQYLLENGCSMERSQRPSGCTWYFCESLLDTMEPQPAYREFDDSLQNAASLWIEMIEEFTRVSSMQSQ